MRPKALAKRKTKTEDYGIPDAEMPELTAADFARAQPNRFARHLIALDEDVAKYFHTSDEVNEALRTLITLTQRIHVHEFAASTGPIHA